MPVPARPRGHAHRLPGAPGRRCAPAFRTAARRGPSWSACSRPAPRRAPDEPVVAVVADSGHVLQGADASGAAGAVGRGECDGGELPPPRPTATTACRSGSDPGSDPEARRGARSAGCRDLPGERLPTRLVVARSGRTVRPGARVSSPGEARGTAVEPEPSTVSGGIDAASRARQAAAAVHAESARGRRRGPRWPGRARRWRTHPPRPRRPRFRSGRRGAARRRLPRARRLQGNRSVGSVESRGPSSWKKFAENGSPVNRCGTAYHRRARRGADGPSGVQHGKRALRAPSAASNSRGHLREEHRRPAKGQLTDRAERAVRIQCQLR